jgi:hypothetical protein
MNNAQSLPYMHTFTCTSQFEHFEIWTYVLHWLFALSPPYILQQISALYIFLTFHMAFIFWFHEWHHVVLPLFHIIEISLFYEYHYCTSFHYLACLKSHCFMNSTILYILPLCIMVKMSLLYEYHNCTFHRYVKWVKSHCCMNTTTAHFTVHGPLA